MNSNESDGIDHNLLINYLEKSQKIFQLGNELNFKIDNFKLDIDLLQTEFKIEIDQLKKSNQILIDKLKESKILKNGNSKSTETEEINVSHAGVNTNFIDDLIQNGDSNSITVSHTGVNTDFVDEETMEPRSPSIIHKTPEPKTNEQEALDKLLAMMNEDNFEDESEIPVENGSNLMETDENQNIDRFEMKKSKSFQPFSDCKVTVRRLSLDNLDHLNLSPASISLFKVVKQSNEMSKEDKKLDRLCNLNLDKLFSKAKTSQNSSKKMTNTKSEETKTETEESEQSQESSDEAEEVMQTENLETPKQDSKEEKLVEMMNADNFEITDDESEMSSTSDSDEPKPKNKSHKETKIVSDESSNDSEKPKKKVLEPDLVLNLKDPDVEENKENSKSRTSKTPKKKKTENEISECLPTLDLDENSSEDTLVEENEEKETDSDDENIGKLSKRASKRLTSETSDEKVKSSQSDEDEIIGKKKKSYLTGILASDMESNASEADENKENVIDDDSKTSEETLSNKKRKRVRLKNSDSESSVHSSKTKAKNKLKKLKKELDYSESNSVQSSDSDIQSIHSSDEESPQKDVTRHKLRNIIGDGKLTKETLDAIQAERERKKRIEEKRALETSLHEEEREDMYLDIDNSTKKPLVKVDPAIAKLLKPHQIEGLKFMWDSCYEKCEMIEKGNKGSGCLLAHCMGLGKTFQVIALVHTLLTNKDLTKCKRVLVLLPVNVLTNWKKEFRNWTKSCKNQISVFELPTEKGFNKDLTRARLNELENWFRKGGVLLVGYTLFARLVSGKSVKPKKLVENFNRCLLSPGPDLVICDEGHMLKTEATALNKSVSQIETLRRIVLTGTPLQNNLIEYHCMVSFVKPNLLGTIKEFKNRFVNPISNGQHKDSTEADVRYMKKRAHILHNVLDGCVQRKDYSVIRDLLRPKKEYVLSIRLSEKQIELYRTYINFRGINLNNFGKVKGAQLFCDFQNLYRVWTHPWVLKLNEVRVIRQEEKLAEQKFIADDDDDLIDNEEEEQEKGIILPDEDDDIIDISVDRPRKSGRKSEFNGGGVNIDLEKKPPERWWTGMVSDDDEFDVSLSGKLVLLEQILKLCAERGDKLLLFSQGLLSLDIIEKFLEKITLDKKDRWRREVDYFRMDGQTDIQKRQHNVDRFNDEDNHRARLFLISTRAGGIGINLVGANRCIIFDASWNPSYDTQSIFRIYRFGQKKEVFVYRFLAQGTMEEKIYQRQVTKQSLSQRVIDEHQIDRHFTSQEIRELYNFEPDIWDGSNTMTYDIPDDDLLKSLLLSSKQWICKFHEHDSLLENKVNEGLSEEDRKAAWEEYENEKKSNIFNHSEPGLNGHVPNQNGAHNFDDYLHILNNLYQQEKSANRPSDHLKNQIQAMQRQQLHAQLQAQMELQDDILKMQEMRSQHQINQMRAYQQQQQTGQRVHEMVQNNQRNLNIRVPVGQRSELEERPLMNNAQYLASILGTPRPAPVNTQLQQGLTLEQQQQQQRQIRKSSSPSVNATHLINQHRKQIQQQTFSPQQPIQNKQSNVSQNQSDK